MKPVRFRLDIFVAELAHRHDHRYVAAIDADVELPFAAFYPFDGLLLRDAPALTLLVKAANVSDTNPLNPVSIVAMYSWAGPLPAILILNVALPVASNVPVSNMRDSAYLEGS
jgi:hypothetical protein